MFKQHNLIVCRSLMFLDICMTVAAFLIAYWIRDYHLVGGRVGGLYPLERYIWLLYIIIPVWIILFRIFGSYRSFRTTSFTFELFAVGKAIVTGGIIVGFCAFFVKAKYLSRAYVITFVIVNIVLVALERLSVRNLAWIVRGRGYNYRNVLIVGTDDTARDIAQRIMIDRESGLRILGFVSDQQEPVGSCIDDHLIIGTIDDVESIVLREVVDEVIFAVPSRKLEALEDTFLMLEENGISARIVANIFPHIIAKMSVEELETVPFLTFSTAPGKQVSLFAKRIIDIVISVFLLVVCLPIMAVTAILVKATSKGAVLFLQKRSGLRGRVFTLYKFRSMYSDAEAQREKLEKLNEMEGPAFKIRCDPRITRVGSFIRKASIDELPQLWNVLRGDMSIVGPRPPIPDEVTRYQRWQRRRLSMRPGLTCIWQISGRNKISNFNDWVRLDLQYIDTWSLALDMSIILKTIPVVLFRSGAQ